MTSNWGGSGWVLAFLPRTLELRARSVKCLFQVPRSDVTTFLSMSDIPMARLLWSGSAPFFAANIIETALFSLSLKSITGRCHKT